MTIILLLNCRVLFEENGDPRIRRSTEAPTMSATFEGTDISSGSAATSGSSTETNFTTDITASETEGSSEEWVDNEENWSNVTAPESLDINETDTSPINVDDGEEDWSEVDEDGSSNSNLYCGETQSDAASNCGVEGNACPDGVCSDDLKCYMVGECGSYSNNTFDDNSGLTSPSPAPANDISSNEESSQVPTLNTVESSWVPTFSILESDSPVSSLSLAPVSTDSEENPSGGFDIKNTFYCGVDRADAATSCSTRCRSGSSDECPSGMS
jgi:hypothetical protein